MHNKEYFATNCVVHCSFSVSHTRNETLSKTHIYSEHVILTYFNQLISPFKTKSMTYWMQPVIFDDYELYEAHLNEPAVSQ